MRRWSKKTFGPRTAADNWGPRPWIKKGARNQPPFVAGPKVGVTPKTGVCGRGRRKRPLKTRRVEKNDRWKKRGGKKACGETIISRRSPEDQ